jgi:hypothetical protein
MGDIQAGPPPEWIDVVINTLWRRARSGERFGDSAGCLTYPAGRNINTANGGRFSASDRV